MPTGGLLQPYIPDVSDWFKAANQGYALGDTIRNRDLSVQAGQQAASGNMLGARSTLYGGGNFEAARGIDTHQKSMDAATRAASNDQLTRALKVQGALADVAHSITTPEEFEAAKGTLAKAGLPGVDKYNFADLPTLRAQALDIKTKLELALKERALESGSGKLPDRAKIAREGGLTPGTPEYQQFLLHGPEKAAAKPENEQKLRADYVNQTKTFRDVQHGLKRVEVGSSSNSGAGDMALVYGFMKLNDPTSVVRESEYSMAENIGSVPERWRSAVQRMLTGERLPPRVREEMAGISRKLVEPHMQQQQIIAQQYRGIAERSGIDPRNVLVDYGFGETNKPVPSGGFGTMLDRSATPKGVAGAAVDLRHDTEGVQYAKLPSGARFIAPDGSERIKP